MEYYFTGLTCHRCGAPYKWSKNPTLASFPPPVLLKTCGCAGGGCEDERPYRVEWWAREHFAHLDSRNSVVDHTETSG